MVQSCSRNDEPFQTKQSHQIYLRYLIKSEPQFSERKEFVTTSCLHRARTTKGQLGERGVGRVGGMMVNLIEKNKT